MPRICAAGRLLELDATSASITSCKFSTGFTVMSKLTVSNGDGGGTVKEYCAWLLPLAYDAVDAPAVVNPGWFVPRPKFA